MMPCIRIRAIAVLLLCWLWYHPATAGRRIYIRKAADNGCYAGPSLAYAPGDTLVLQAAQNPYTYFALDNIHGAPGKPVVIVNEGGTVQMVNGIACGNCTYVHISGTGAAGSYYGFRIADPAWNGVGVDLHGRCAFIEADHLDFYNKTYGFWVKQEASCADSLQYPHWVIHDISLHDNRIVKMGQEGMYLGSTNPTGGRPVQCNGKLITPLPLRLGNIRVYNNRIDSTWRSGIQLSGADSGINEIYGNLVTHAGFELNTSQGNGISLGGFSHAHIYNNIIRQTFALGILCLGSGYTEIDRNQVDSSGYLHHHRANGMAAIMIDTRPTSPVDSTQLYIHHNQLGLNTDYHIRLYKTLDTYAAGNLIEYNNGTVFLEQGIEAVVKGPEQQLVRPSFFARIRHKKRVAAVMAVLLMAVMLLIAAGKKRKPA